MITFECGFYMLPHVTTCLSSYPEGSHFPIRHPSQMSHLSDPISLCLPITFCSRYASKRPVPTLSLQRMRSQARKKRGHKRCTNLPNLGMQVYTRFGLLPDSRIKLQRGSKVAKQSEAKPSSLQREVLPTYHGETSLLSCFSFVSKNFSCYFAELVVVVFQMFEFSIVKSRRPGTTGVLSIAIHWHVASEKLVPMLLWWCLGKRCDFLELKKLMPGNFHMLPLNMSRLD